MPIARVNDVDLYYEVHGQGPNLVLIEGIGYDLWMWYRQLPAFSQSFRTLVYDNRGVGRSSKPPGPYTHQQNAGDLAGLLDRLGWARTHVLGHSMGGFIAQEFALKYPERVNRLILSSTAFGGPDMVPLPAEAIAALSPVAGESPEERIRRAMPVAFADPDWPKKNPEQFEQIVRWRLEYPQPADAAMAQAMAGLTFNTEGRLSEIRAPTLVITGSQDRVVPPQNSRLLADRIPGSQLNVLEGAGHVCNIEHSDRFNDVVLSFLLTGITN